MRFIKDIDGDFVSCSHIKALYSDRRRIYAAIDGLADTCLYRCEAGDIVSDCLEDIMKQVTGGN